MQVVIDIPAKASEIILNTSFVVNPEIMMKQTVKEIEQEKAIYSLIDAFRNGIPLPEPHGNLVDENEVIVCIDNRIQFLTKNHPQFVRKCGHIDMVGCIGKIREEVHKIIPATKGE